MAFSALLIVHICGAIIGLLSGWTALAFRKGSRRHGKAGSVFFVSMIAMSLSAACMAVMKHELMNVIVGVLTFYLVATAWLAVRRKEGEIGLLEVGAMVVALTDGAACMVFAWQAAHSATGSMDGYPAGGFVVFGSVALLCAAWDVRMLARGGVFGALRISRHLSRMCAALLITTLSFFLGKQRLFPEAVVRAHLNLVPIFANAVVMIYWLCRVSFTNAYKRKIAASPIRTVATNNLA
jgi:hypothetical protein